MSNRALCPACKQPGIDVTDFEAEEPSYLCLNVTCPGNVGYTLSQAYQPKAEQTTAREARHSSARQDWGTPPAILEAARSFLGGITLDPASSPEHNLRVQAASYYTEEDNGLAQEWVSRSVWLNPPYGKAQVPVGRMFEIGKEPDKKYLLSGRAYSSQMLWTYKLLAHFQAGDISEALLLINAETAAKWFEPLWNYPICFIRGRIKFINPETGKPGGSPTHGSALVYLGPKGAPAFHRAFGQLGRIVTAYIWE